MMRRSVRVIGALVLFALLLAVVAGAARCGEAEQSRAASAAGDTERADDTVLVCLALVGGTALLAGGAWMGQLRRMLS